MYIIYIYIYIYMSFCVDLITIGVANKIILKEL